MVGGSRHWRWSLIIMLFSIWGHQAKERKNKRKTDTKVKKKKKSQTKHVSRSHTRHNQNQGQPLVNLQSMLHSILAGWPRGPPLVWRAASAEHDAKNWEVHWYPQTSAKTKSLTRMPTAEKTMKERGCTQMPVAKKERTSRKCPGQRKKDQTTNDGGKRKMAALIRKANEKRLP